MKEFENMNFEIVQDFRIILDCCANEKAKQDIKFHTSFQAEELNSDYILNLDKYIFKYCFRSLEGLLDCCMSGATSVFFIRYAHMVFLFLINQVS